MKQVETSSGNNIIIVVPGSNATLSEQEVEKADSMIQNAKLISFGLEGNHESVIKAMEISRKYGVKTMTNAAPARSDLDPRYENLITHEKYPILIFDFFLQDF